jgi:hypothetical protein
MAIIDARVLRSAKLTEAKSDKGSIQFSASEELLILCDAKDPTFSDILENTATWPNLFNRRLPQLDDQLVVRGKTLYVTTRDLSYYKDNERAVVMSVRYDAKDEEAGGGGDPGGGDQEAWARVTVQSVTVTKPARGYKSLNATVDADPRLQRPPVNSVGEPVDGLEEEASLLRFSYTNTIAQNPNFRALAGYVNKCNRGLLTILGVSCSFYTVRCTGFNAQYDQKNNVWSVTVELLYNPQGWEITYYNVGFNEVINGRRRAIVDFRGNPISSPVPLRADGTAELPGIDDSESSETAGGASSTRVLYPYISTDLQSLFRQCNI